ncbi:ATP synthase F1 subunit delta [Coriobacteriales bacterium OH1046]|nr:ATP synthase F1 subunit delta [Coriobacteriales bacterium OH1046]
MNQIAERYAQAFFSLAKDEDAVAELKGEASALKAVCDRDLIRLLDNRSVTKDEKKALFRESIRGADRNLMNLLYLLVDEGRGHYLAEILGGFISLCNEDLGIQEVMVYSARPLTEEERAEIGGAVGGKLGKAVEIANRIDESLLAGTRILINDRVYDSSLKAKVRSLKEELLRESW